MVHLVVYRLYSPQEAITMAEQPDLLVARIRADRQRDPMAVIEATDSTQAAAFVEVLSRAFGVAVMDINHDSESLDSSHYLLDQGRSMLKEAKRISKKVVDD